MELLISISVFGLIVFLTLGPYLPFLKNED